MKALDYDGVIEMVMADIKCLASARKDTYYLETVKPDEEKFIELSQIRYMVGWVETYIHRGKAVGGGDDHYYADAEAHGGDEGVGVEYHEAR
jgi:hypothetical protein